MRRFEDRLGRALGVIVNVLDPDVIVLGGGLSNVARLYETVPPLIRSHVFGEQVQHPTGAEPARRQLRGPRRGLAVARARARRSS